MATPLSLSGSGPQVARLFQRLLAVVFAIAWASLGAQIHELIGSRGLLPLVPFVEALRARGTSSMDAPTLFLWIDPSDTALSLGVALGIMLAASAFAGFAPRACFAASTALYLSYAVAGRTFLSFQWDNLLIECGALAVLLPRDRSAPIPHLLFRVLVFKLYWESGIAKWQSPLHDWHDGSAMTYYFETAPLPTPLAHAAHALPAWWHRLESWLTLALELLLPLCVFGPRKARLAAFAGLTGFQIVNAATANYGFFCYLSVALHVFLLDDTDVAWLSARARAALSFLPFITKRESTDPSCAPHTKRARAARIALLTATSLYIGLSALEALLHFGDRTGELAADAAPLRSLYAPFRVVNTYHLFAAITRERVEAEVQTFDGATWIAHDLRYKPGDVNRAPPFVAPHQPRLDFQLWFYGLGHRRSAPPYVTSFLTRVCEDPQAVQSFFPAKLPERPIAARVAFFRYRFTPRGAPAWWSREPAGSTPPTPCGAGLEPR